MKVYFRPAKDFADLANEIFEKQKNRIVQLIPLADVQHIGELVKKFCQF